MKIFIPATKIILMTLLLLTLSFAHSKNKIIPYSFSGDQVSRLFTLTANGREIMIAELPAMEAKERQQLCDEYKKLPSYCHIYDPSGMHLHYAHLSTDDDAVIQIRATEEIKEFRVHPLAWNIQAKADGNKLRFTSGRNHQPRYYIVDINQLPPLMIAIDPLEKKAVDPNSASVINAARFLTDKSGAMDQTQAFQQAFATADGTGKTLYIAPGIYLVDQLHIRGGRNFKIYLSAGCLIRVKPSVAGENLHRHGLWLQDCHDIAIIGRGAIDQQAYENYVINHNNYQHGMVDYYTCNDLCPWITQSPLFITGSQRILVDGITIRNGRNFNVNVRNCDDVTLRRIKIFTPPACTPEYGDGINTGSCRKVLVENCLVACNDDCFASGHYFETLDRRSSENHVIRNLLGWNLRANAVRLGFYAAYDQGDYIFENCNFVGMICSSLQVHGLRPKPDGRPNRYGIIRMTHCNFDDAPLLKQILRVESAAVQDFILEDVSFFGPAKTNATWIMEGDSSAGIGRLLLKNVTLNAKKIMQIEQIPTRIKNVANIEVK